VTFRTSLRVLAALLPCAAPAAAQGVLVAPTAVFIDARARTATLMLVNPNEEPAEVEIGTLYGYPVTDSTGQLTLKVIDAPDSTEPSAAGWIRAFPRRMTLAPKAQQTVRLLVSPPPGTPDGEYWGRLSITARGGTLALSQPSDTGAVSVGLSVEVRTIIPVLYRKGRLETGIGLSALRAERVGDSLVVRAHLERLGTAAAFGTARGELVDSAGKVRSTFTAPLSAYVAIDPRFSAPLDSVPPGRYQLRVEISPGRLDLAPESVIPFTAVRDSLPVHLP
jgi:P pilus assembly chaperone PapD